MLVLMVGLAAAALPALRRMLTSAAAVPGTRAAW
jgi:hypothetical protein